MDSREGLFHRLRSSTSAYTWDALWRKSRAGEEVKAAKAGEPRLAKVLGVWELIAYGIGGTVGAGIFVVTGVVAKEKFVLLLLLLSLSLSFSSSSQMRPKWSHALADTRTERVLPSCSLSSTPASPPSCLRSAMQSLRRAFRCRARPTPSPTSLLVSFSVGCMHAATASLPSALLINGADG